MTSFRSNLNEYNWDKFFEEFNNETPRAAVIISGAFLDSLLRDLLSSFMIENDKIVDELLGTENNSDTPLSSFGARMKLAYCLGLISHIEYNDLKCIKLVRNKFAHKLHGYSFEEKEIIKYCDKLQTPKLFNDFFPSLMESHQNKFVFAVSILSNQLGVKILGIQKERRIKQGDVCLGEVVRLNRIEG